MTIGIDIDNTIINSVQAVLEQYYIESGHRLCSEKIATYGIENYVLDDFKDDFSLIFMKRETWQKAKVIDGCISVIKRLYNQGYQIYFITVTDPSIVNAKINILQQALPFINVRKHLITTPLKQIIDCDILIDDCVNNVVNAKHYYSILLDYAWNHNFDDASDDKIYRVFNWSQVEPMIKYIEKIRS